MADSSNNHASQTQVLEHDSTAPQTKRVSLYAWDREGMQKKRLSSDAFGNLGFKEADYITKVDESTSTTTYIGKAAPGTAGSGSGWQIKRIDTGALAADILFADGDTNFDNVWSARTGLSYS